MKVFWLALFYLVARHLPPSDAWIVGPAAKFVRSFVASRTFLFAGSDINVQRGCYIGSGTGISLGDRSSIGVQCEIHGPVTIGKHVMMGPHVAIYTQNHCTADTNIPMIDQGYDDSRHVVIEDDVWIGAAVLILPGVRVGTGSILAAGAVISKDVPAYSVVAGNPGKVIRDRRMNSRRDKES